MSNIIQEIEIWRESSCGEWYKLGMIVSTEDDTIFYESLNEAMEERQGVSEILQKFREDFGSDHLRSNIRRGFRKLRQNDLDGDTDEAMVVYKVPQPHFSCKKSDNEDFTIQNGISQTEVKFKLSKMSKDSEVIKLFEENKCCVCLSNYKQVLDGELHIVVSSCGHPLCCQCADNILNSEKKECPRCRGNINEKSFNLMKFNADLEMETQEESVYL